MLPQCRKYLTKNPLSERESLFLSALEYKLIHNVFFDTADLLFSARSLQKGICNIYTLYVVLMVVMFLYNLDASIGKLLSKKNALGISQFTGGFFLLSWLSFHAQATASASIMRRILAISSFILCLL